MDSEYIIAVAIQIVLLLLIAVLTTSLIILHGVTFETAMMMAMGATLILTLIKTIKDK